MSVIARGVIILINISLFIMNEEDILKEIGKRVRYLRKQKGFSQERFAIDSGIERSHYGHFERGNKNVGIITMVKMAYLLDVEVGELFPKKDILFKFLNEKK